MIPETPRAIRETLAELSFRPRRRQGQNFLGDPNIRDAVVRDSEAGPGDLVLEIGSGLGTLTKGLVAAGADVISVERDPVLAEFVAVAFAGEERLTLIQGDVLGKGGLAPAVTGEIARRRAAAKRFLLVANLPYSISSPVLVALYSTVEAPDRGVVMVQKEVAERMAGRVGTSDYGPLAVLLALRGEVRILREVGAQAFVPRPPVRSAVALITAGRLSIRAAEIGTRTARRAFRYRRKTIRKALRSVGYDVGPVEAALAACGIEPSARPETVPPETWVELGRQLPEECGGP